MQQTLLIIVKGKVQGVYFRQRTREAAMELGIAGTVRNLADGSVEIVATGPVTALEQLARWCHKGPSRAKVEEVIVREQPLRPSESFTILR
jgi:acylphosphatase